MDTYIIYHATNPTFGFGNYPSFPSEYEKVAAVSSENLGDTFRISNHIDASWTKNPEVIELFTKTPRSTSVGDVVEDPEGNFHYCDSVGWKLLSEVEAEQQKKEDDEEQQRRDEKNGLYPEKSDVAN